MYNILWYEMMTTGTLCSSVFKVNMGKQRAFSMSFGLFQP